MIIKRKRIRARGPAFKRALNHVMFGDDNDEVELVCGNLADLDDARADALRLGREYAIREFIVAPECEISVEQRVEIVAMLGEEFEFNPKHVVCWRHKKERATGEEATDQHFHFWVREVDAVTGRVMSCSNDYARHEKISRIAESRWKHRAVPGAHNSSVLRFLDNEGLSGLATDLRDTGKFGEPSAPQSYDNTDHQRLKRAGFDLPRLQLLIAESLSRSKSQTDFVTKLADSGLRFRSGEKFDTPIIETTDGIFVGGLARLTRLRKSALAERLKFDVPNHPTTKTHHSSSDLSRTPETDGGPGTRRQARGTDGGSEPSGSGGGDNRVTSEPDRRRRPDSEPAGKSGGPPRRDNGGKSVEGRRTRITFALGCVAQQHALLDLLAVARRSAQSPIERVVGDLNQAIEDNTSIISRPSELPEPLALLTAREEVGDAKERLQSAEAEADATRQKINDLPVPAAWRGFLQGGQQEIERQRLESHLEKQQGHVRKAGEELASAQHRLDAEEKGHRLAQAKHGTELVRKVEQAARQIKIAEQARGLVTRNPRLAVWGSQRLMQVAVWVDMARADRRDQSLSHDWDYGATDIWGIPYLPPSTV